MATRSRSPPRNRSSDPSNAAAPEAISVFTFAGELIFETPAEIGMRVRDLKAKLQEARGVPTCRQRILYKEAPLDDSCPLTTVASFTPAHLGFVALAFDESEEARQALTDACAASDPTEVNRVLQLPANPNAEGDVFGFTFTG